MPSTLPTFSDVSLDVNFNLPACVLDKNSPDPLGINHYSYFENLDVDPEIRRQMSVYVDSYALLFMTWKEENAAFWLTELYKLTNDPLRRLTLLEEAYEEQEHFSVLIGIIRQLYSDDYINQFWATLKEEYDRNRKFEYSQSRLNDGIFDYAANEIKVLAYVDQLKEHTTLPGLSAALNPIISDEWGHLDYGPIFIGKEKIAENKLMYIQKLYEYFREPFKKFTPGHISPYVAIACNDHGLDYNQVVAAMQTSRRHRDFVLKIIPLYYKFGQAFGFFATSDFETTLKTVGVYDQYMQLQNA